MQQKTLAPATRIAGAAVAIVGLAVLAGWFFDLVSLKSMIPHGPTMQERRKTSQKMLTILMHEIYNPLTGIIGNLGLLKSETVSAGIRECLKDMDDSAQKIRTILSEMKGLDLENPEILTGGGGTPWEN